MKNHRPEAIDETPVSTGEALVLMSGIVTCLCLYVMDILAMLGV